MKRCKAIFQPQALINDYTLDIDGRVEFDITDYIEEMGRDAALAVTDDSYESDEFAERAGLLEDHNGPFYVACEEAIRAYFGACK